MRAGSGSSLSPLTIPRAAGPWTASIAKPAASVGDLRLVEAHGVLLEPLQVAPWLDALVTVRKRSGPSR